MAITKVTRTLLSTGIDDQSTATAITIDSSEDINLTNHFNTGNNKYVNILDADGDVSGRLRNVSGGSNSLTIEADPNNSAASTFLSFKLDADEKMRIDSSGNLLVGKTSTAFGTAGVRAVFNGQLQATADGNEPLGLNRLSSDGSLIDFYKDTSPVGSIGIVSGNNLKIHSTSSGHSGLSFGTGIVYATDNSGDATNGGTDLGSSSYTWKDIYLGGGAYIGGTGSANKLDDYEEGTWTPAAGGWSGTYSTQEGYYTKVGNLVTAWYEITANGGTGSFSQTYLMLFGLPFAIIQPTNFSTINGHWNLLYTGNTGNPNSGVWDGTFPNYVTDTGSSDGVANYTTSMIITSNNWQMRGTLTYRTSA